MKLFVEPTVEAVMFSVEDIITTSSNEGGAGGEFEGPGVDL